MGSRTASERLRLTRGEAGVLAGLLLLTAAPLVLQLVRVWRGEGVLTGADGLVVVDQLQYLGWVREAAAHGLVGNPFAPATAGSGSFLHPGLVLSGLAHRLGAGVAVAYLAWLPAAALVLFSGALALVRRFLPVGGARTAALALALLACSPIAALTGWTDVLGAHDRLAIDFATGELWTGTYLWGYPFTVIAVGLLPLAVLAYERGRAGSGRALTAAAGAGLLCAWLQPWQGATLAIVIVAVEAWALGAAADRRTVVAAAVRHAGPVLAAITVPLLYYLVLSHADDHWRRVGQANDVGSWPWWVSVLALSPMAIPAAFAYRRRAWPAADAGAVALRVWPGAALLVFVLPVGTFPAHTFQALGLPLAVLAVLGARSWWGGRGVPVWAAALAVVLLVVPGTLYRLDSLRGAIQLDRQAYVLTAGERAALRALEAMPGAGSVVAGARLGPVVPAYTGRDTWIGADSWTPDLVARTVDAERLLRGAPDPASARALVEASGARWILVDCQQDAAAARRALGELVVAAQTHGCAHVLEVRP